MEGGRVRTEGERAGSDVRAAHATAIAISLVCFLCSVSVGCFFPADVSVVRYDTV